MSQTPTLLERLRAQYPDASNRRLRQWLAQGKVRVGGRTVKVGATPVPPGAAVEVAHRPEPEPEPVGLGIDVLYEDRHLLVITKPAGALTVAGGGETRQTAIARLEAYVRRRHPRGRAYVVHRLDRDASGLLVFARARAAQQQLKRQFAQHAVDREYLAVVEGRVEEDRGTRRSRLVEHRDFTVTSTRAPRAGRPAVTHYRVRHRGPDTTTLQVRLETGRKHQIRVHCAELGHPVIGDARYGARTDPLGRLGLHAHRLGFHHPVTGRRLTFETGVPEALHPYCPSEAAGVPSPSLRKPTPS